MPIFQYTDESDLDADDKAFDPEEVPRAVTAFGGSMVTKGFEMSSHRHRKAQMVLALRGLVRCETDLGMWIVPPRCAVWIPSEARHAVTFCGDVEVYCLFVETDKAAELPVQCCALAISPLRENLILHAARMPVLYDEQGPDARLVAVLLDQLAQAPVEQLNFPMPSDGKLRRIATALIADPADRATPISRSPGTPGRAGPGSSPFCMEWDPAASGQAT